MARKVVALVGNPNVGKSVIFNYLTGARTHVSNYPGTTVEIAKGRLIWQAHIIEIIDTPGLYSFSTLTEEEKVARRVLWEIKPDLLIHVIDAKNLQRMLPLTFQLQETGLTLMINLNMMDEARKLKLRFNIPLLESYLSCKVIPTTSIHGEGMEQLRQQVINHVNI